MRFLLAILLLLVAAPAWAQQGQGMSQAVVVSSCGGGTLPTGAVNQLTMNPAGQLCLSGIGSSCPQATSYLGRTVGGNEGGNAANIIALICGLVADGVWGSLDALYVTAQQNQADAVLNLVGTNYSLTPVSSPVFTAYQGFNSGGSGWLDSGFTPSTAVSPHYTLNSASFAIWAYATTSETITQIVTTDQSSYYDNYPTVGVIARVNTGSFVAAPTTITGGLSAGERTDASTVYIYQNGVTTGPGSAAAVKLDAAPFLFGRSSIQIISAAFISSALGGGGQLAVYNRFRTYMTAVGVP